MKKILLFILGAVPLGLGWCIAYMTRMGTLPLDAETLAWAAPAAVAVLWLLLAYVCRGLARTKIGAAVTLSLPAFLIAAAAAVQAFLYDLTALWGESVTELLGYFYAPFVWPMQKFASLLSGAFDYWQVCALSFVVLLLLACLGCGLKRDRGFR